MELATCRACFGVVDLRFSQAVFDMSELIHLRGKLLRQSLQIDDWRGEAGQQMSRPSEMMRRHTKRLSIASVSRVSVTIYSSIPSRRAEDSDFSKSNIYQILNPRHVKGGLNDSQAPYKEAG